MKSRRLLLIAMSGVRVHDKKLFELGMTLPGFVERSKVIASLPSLSLLTVAAASNSQWATDEENESLISEIYTIEEQLATPPPK